MAKVENTYSSRLEQDLAEAAANAEAHARALEEQERLIAQAFRPLKLAQAVKEQLDEEAAERIKKQEEMGSPVEVVWSDRGERLYTIPFMHDEMDGTWGETVFEFYESPQEMEHPSGLYETVSDEHNFRVDLRQQEGGFAVKMVDTLSGERTRVRLDGTLTPQDFGELGTRLIYKQNTETFIHPSVSGQLPATLTSLVTAITENPPSWEA